eukprot:1187205-Prorocentrum_minimum.AAC.3
MHRRNDDEKEEEAAESAYTYTIIRVMISSFCHGGWQGGSAAAHQQEEEGISSAGLPGSAAATELCEPIFYDFSAAARAQKRVNLLGRGDDENNKDKNDENARGQHPTRSTSRRHSAVSTSRQKYPGLPTAVCMSVSLRSLPDKATATRRTGGLAADPCAFNNARSERSSAWSTESAHGSATDQPADQPADQSVIAAVLGAWSCAPPLVS